MKWKIPAALALVAVLAGCASDGGAKPEAPAKADDSNSWVVWRLIDVDKSKGVGTAAAGDFSFAIDERSFYEETTSSFGGCEADLLGLVRSDLGEVTVQEPHGRPCVVSTKLGVREPSGLRITSPLDGDRLTVELFTILHTRGADGVRHPHMGTYVMTYRKVNIRASEPCPKLPSFEQGPR